MFNGIKEKAKRDLDGNWGFAIILYVLVLFINTALNYLSILATGIISVAIADIFMKIACRRKPEFENLLDPIKNWQTNIIAGLLYCVYTFLWSLLFIIPGIIKALSMSQTFYLLNDDKTLTADKAIVKSQLMMEGHKMELFSLCLSFIGWIILSVITCGIVGIYVWPYMQATLANYYFELRNDQFNSKKQYIPHE